jgi:hypothetical protein
MEKLKFIYFEGCPNAQIMKTALNDLGYELEEIEQNSLPSGNPYKDYSSPTILKNSKLIYGEKAAGGGCSLNMPDLKKLKEMLS